MYNWAKIGTDAVVKQNRQYKQFICIAAVSRFKLIKLDVSESYTTTETFCSFMSGLRKSLLAEQGLDSRRVIFFMDQASYHHNRQATSFFK